MRFSGLPEIRGQSFSIHTSCVYYSVLQCVAVCLTDQCVVLASFITSGCSVLRSHTLLHQCVVVCCSVLQCVAVCYSALQCVASVSYARMLYYISVLQCVVVCYKFAAVCYAHILDDIIRVMC